MKEKERIIEVYRKRAVNYDRAMMLYNLIGFKINRYRIDMVDWLDLDFGDTVIDLGCGTGVNFELIQQHIGDKGKIIGIDMSKDMLFQAKRRIDNRGWKNVRLIESDLAEYKFDKKADAVISSYAITLVPEYDKVLKGAARALKKDGRVAVLDFKLPDWPMWLIKIAAKILVGPYAGTIDMAMVRHPDESVKRYLNEIMHKEYYFGSAYLSVGQK